MRYKYLMVDSRGNPVAHVSSDDGPDKSVWQVRAEDGDIKRILSHEYVSLLGVSEELPAMEGRVTACHGNMISIAPVRTLGEDVRRNLRIPVRFESFLYPVSGRWRGRVPILSNDLSCGGIAFFCARKLEVGEIAQIVIPVTAQPLLLDLKILRQRPSGEPVPLYAGAFMDLLHDQEKLVREAVFGIQLHYTPDASIGKDVTR